MRKVKFNIKNVHYSVISEGTNGTLTFATPKKIPGAVNLSLTASGDESIFWADGIKYYRNRPNNGYSGSLEVALLPQEFATEVLGYVKTDDGRVREIATVEPKAFALLFEVDGDADGARYIFYNVAASRPDFNAQTTTETKEPQTDTISIDVTPLDNGVVKDYALQSDSAYANWFSNVTYPTLGEA